MSVHQADPQERKRTLWLTGVIIVLGIAALWWVRQWLQQIDRMLAADQVNLVHQQVDAVVRSVRLLLAISCLGAAGLLAQIAARAHTQRRFPPLEAKLLRAMQVQQGEAANMPIYLCVALAVLFAISSLIAMPWQLLFGT